MEVKEFSNRVKEYSKKLGLPPNDISKITGISRVSIGNYERGSRVPDAEVLEKLASALNVSTDYLIGRTNLNVDRNDNIVISKKEYENLLLIKSKYERVLQVVSN